MAANVGNLCTIWRFALKSHDCAAYCLGSSDDKWVCIEATLQELFALDDLEEVRNRKKSARQRQPQPHLELEIHRFDLWPTLAT